MGDNDMEDNGVKRTKEMRKTDGLCINECYDSLSCLEPVICQKIGRNGQIQEQSGPVLQEHEMDVYVNERLTMKLVCIPQYLTELVLGRLLTEGMIRGIEDVRAVSVCERGTQARVWLTDKSGGEGGAFVGGNAACCTANQTPYGGFREGESLASVRPVPWRTDWIFSLADRFAAGMPLHDQTWCTHSGFLAKEDRLLFQCEDIGRHNALDKLIGHALRQGIDLTGCMVYSSGRIPVDMAEKAIRAGIPILASKASPTGQAVRLAQAYGLTLICGARRDCMKLYAGPLPEDG